MALTGRGPRADDPLTGGTSTAVQLPAPSSCDVAARSVVWRGGVERIGQVLRIPGRCLDLARAEDRAAAEQHARAVLAAVRHDPGPDR